MIRSLPLLSLLLLSVPPAEGEVIDSSPHGFTSRNGVSIAAPPAEVFAALVQEVSAWWSPDHTYSGDAGNLSIDPRQGGCFCERLPAGGSVRHLSVVYVDPGKALRLRGGLGPLQATAASGALTWDLAETESGTEVTVTYAVGGYVADGIDSWAAGVDRVVGEQLTRLARFIETGDPHVAADESERVESETGGSSR